MTISTGSLTARRGGNTGSTSLAKHAKMKRRSSTLHTKTSSMTSSAMVGTRFVATEKTASTSFRAKVVASWHCRTIPTKTGRFVIPLELTPRRSSPDELEQWELTNARDGYMIRNVASGTCLGVSVTEQFPPYYEVNSRGEGYSSWSLNPISFPGKQIYQ